MANGNEWRGPGAYAASAGWTAASVARVAEEGVSDDDEEFVFFLSDGDLDLAGERVADLEAWCRERLAGGEVTL